MMNKLMKKIATALTVATMIITTAAGSVSAYGVGIEQSQYADVQDRDFVVTLGQYGANIRAGASTDTEILTTLDPGTKVQITGLVYYKGKPSDWYRVNITNGKAAYINEITFDYMAGAAPAAATTSSSATTTETTLQQYMDTHYEKEAIKAEWDIFSTKTVYVQSGYLALRTVPTYDAANEIEQLYNGDTVEIMGGISGSYVYVCAESGNCGWVNAGFLY